MKLLYCDECGDIFNLTHRLKTCSCGNVAGKYVDNRYAEVNGNGFSLAIGNGSFHKALMNHLAISGTREEYIVAGKIEYCWIRPHEGPGNPHTRVNPDLM